MTPAIVRKQIRIKASAEALWPYIGTEAGLRQWWGSDITIEPKQGGYCEERSHVQGTCYRLWGNVTAYDPPRHLGLVLRHSDSSRWPALTTLHITLEPEGEETLVTLVHQAFGTVPESTHHLDARLDLPTDASDPTVTSNHLVHRYPLAYQRIAQAMPLSWPSSLPLHPQLAEQLLATFNFEPWLAAQRVEWTARAQRLVAYMGKKENGCHLS